MPADPQRHPPARDGTRPSSRRPGPRSLGFAVSRFPVDAELHGRVTTALLAANRRDISLVDWTAFEIMRERAVTHAFAFDDDFERQGYTTLTGER